MSQLKRPNIAGFTKFFMYYYLHILVRIYSMLTFDGKQAEGFVIDTLFISDFLNFTVFIFESNQIEPRRPQPFTSNLSWIFEFWF